jgi:ABC-type glycerol-3-phosphate transport system substrate-binding protein
VLGAGTLATITKDSPAAHAFIDFLKNPISNEIWMAQSGFLSTLKAANGETYGNETLKGEGEILLNATTFRFDGSDLMPGADGRRLVLDRHGRLRGRQVRPGSGRRQVQKPRGTRSSNQRLT